MKTYKLTTERGNTIITGFNGSLEDAKTYYLNRVFVSHEDEQTGKETFDRFVSVEIFPCNQEKHN